MHKNDLLFLTAEIAQAKSVYPVGRISQVTAGLLVISGFANLPRTGDRVKVICRDGEKVAAEILSIGRETVSALAETSIEGVSVNDRVLLLGKKKLAPSPRWIGRIIDPLGNPLDNRPLLRSDTPVNLNASPPKPTNRRSMGARLDTGMAIFNTLLPLVQGQRLGLFAGSGLGKSSLISHFAKHMQADVVVLALIGERGRELADFVTYALGPEGMARSVVVATTSDQSALMRRRCAFSAMSVAEYFRDKGAQVLLLADSITRFAEAHREIAIASGEVPAMRGYPASTSSMIMSLCERAGPGEIGAGDITALFSVLVAGSDMEEPIADILRGVLDGHVVLDRQIAERGRYPAINLLKSLSRSLPMAATVAENQLIQTARQLLGAYEESALMIRAGLYVSGSDPLLDRAIKIWPDLDKFLGDTESLGVENSFRRLADILQQDEVVENPDSNFESS